MKPMVKIECAITDDAPVNLGRKFLPPSLLEGRFGKNGPHEGPLYYSVSGTGNGHTLDLGDQPGQAGQITQFSGEITVTGPYLLFLGQITRDSRIFIKGGGGYSILAPMDGGFGGSRHVEFDGTHFLMPKVTTPTIEFADATEAERDLRPPRHEGRSGRSHQAQGAVSRGVRDHRTRPQTPIRRAANQQYTMAGGDAQEMKASFPRSAWERKLGRSASSGQSLKRNEHCSPAPIRDAERPGLRSHAERGNEEAISFVP
jgi:hypothetical protein